MHRGSFGSSIPFKTEGLAAAGGLILSTALGLESAVGAAATAGRTSAKGAYKTVTTPRNGLHVPWCVRGIIQHLPNPGDCVIQPVIEINEGIGRPQLGMQFFTGDHLAGTFDQYGQDLKGLSRKPQPHPVFTQ